MLWWRCLGSSVQCAGSVCTSRHTGEWKPELQNEGLSDTGIIPVLCVSHTCVGISYSWSNTAMETINSRYELYSDIGGPNESSTHAFGDKHLEHDENSWTHTEVIDSSSCCEQLCTKPFLSISSFRSGKICGLLRKVFVSRSKVQTPREAVFGWSKHGELRL